MPQPSWCPYSYQQSNLRVTLSSFLSRACSPSTSLRNRLCAISSLVARVFAAGMEMDNAWVPPVLTGGLTKSDWVERSRFLDHLFSLVFGFDSGLGLLNSCRAACADDGGSMMNFGSQVGNIVCRDVT